MRKIEISEVGIHFITDAGYVNAHWVDLFGIGISSEIKWAILKSMSRFWRQVGAGIAFLIRGYH